MATQNGTATNYLDLLDKLRRFAAGFGTAGAATPGANTGDGADGVDTLRPLQTGSTTFTISTEGDPLLRARYTFTIDDPA